MSAAGPAPAGTRHAPIDVRRGYLRISSRQRLVVDEVPVQHVELVQRHPVDVALDELRRLVVPRGIEHQPAPCVARLIRDADAWQRDSIRLIRSGCAQHLPQRDRAIVETATIARAHSNSARRSRRVHTIRGMRNRPPDRAQIRCRRAVSPRLRPFRAAMHAQNAVRRAREIGEQPTAGRRWVPPAPRYAA